MAALRELFDRAQQTGDLGCIVGMAKHRQAEGRLGDEDIAGNRLERRAGRIAPTLVVAGNNDGQALPADHHLGAPQDMTRGNQGDGDAVALDGLTVLEAARGPGESLAVADGHDRQGLRRGGHRLVARAGVVGVAMGDHRPVHGPNRVDVEVARGAIEAGRSGAEKVLRPDHFGGPITSGEYRRRREVVPIRAA